LGFGTYQRLAAVRSEPITSAAVAENMRGVVRVDSASDVGLDLDLVGDFQIDLARGTVASQSSVPFCLPSSGFVSVEFCMMLTC
jgi:hypothetical protein